MGRPVYGFVLDVERGKLFEGGSSETPAGQTSGEPPEEGILHIGFQTMRDFFRFWALTLCSGRMFPGRALPRLCLPGTVRNRRGTCRFLREFSPEAVGFAAAYPILRSRGCHVFACELSENRYFVCGFRSIDFTANANPSFRNRCAENSTKMEEIPFMLQIENLEKKFIMHIRGDAEIEGFDCISFSAKAGTLIAVTGPSGSGKSSLLKCIYRTYTPTGGLHLRGRRQRGGSGRGGAWKSSACGPQKSGMSPSFSALSHVFPPSTSSPIPRPPVESPQVRPGTGRRIPGESGNLSPTLGHVSRHLQRRWKQRLNIANALITRPRLLLLDGPTASLDARSKEWVMNMILDLKRGRRRHGRCVP